MDNGKRIVKEIEAKNAIEAGIIMENIYEKYQKKEDKQNEENN